MNNGMGVGRGQINHLRENYVDSGAVALNLGCFCSLGGTWQCLGTDLVITPKYDISGGPEIIASNPMMHKSVSHS